MIILLDLNYTLVANSPKRGTTPPPMAVRLRTENYRLWLVQLVRPHHVILVTARPDRWRALTLARVLAVTGWAPQEAYFNDRRLYPHAWKDWVVRTHLLPRFRPDEMFGIESNSRTRAVYARRGIRAVPVGHRPWKQFPA